MQRRFAIPVALLAGVAIAGMWSALSSADSPGTVSPPAPTGAAKKAIAAQNSVTVDVQKADANAKLRLPTWWKPTDPVPHVKSNCVRCHLTAGRELTAPVQDFARSVHDFQGMTCSDCHGGNRQRDATAHQEEFGFIGTKLSAHMAGCANCHTEPADLVKAGPHYWDFSKKINLAYPVCNDCHGHHDVEKPPAEFALKTVCAECHLRFEKEMPALASVVSENDRLWAVLRKVQEKDAASEHPAPERFHDRLAQARHLTAQIIHPAAKIKPEEAAKLNAQVAAIRAELETWLAGDHPSPSKGPSSHAR